MGTLILCHNKKAKQPYEITRVHLKVYTIEELCYYIYHHLYLIDYTLANRQLCDWLNDELGLTKISEDLRELLNENCTTEQFILKILQESNIYSSNEIQSIRKTFNELKNQKEVERDKFKADELLKSGELESAILIYQKIVNSEWDDTIDISFYGKVYASLASAYGKQFLYSQAAVMYEKAYKYYQNDDILKALLYCYYRSLSEREYAKLLSDQSKYLSVNTNILDDISALKERIDVKDTETQLKIWKNEYRANHIYS